ncbi:hypothetical protein RLPCCGM1_c1260 [Rhizobium leguminosarum bv. phaseoli CCGM1]|uniref:DUF6441 family protein n=1 Tax=Rhizobium phaseoli TaxID=396 RepID=UPI0004D45D73|nr:DUF6441 family protein [Rhizobium phaseoli]KEC73144.1 hypothetical protein RLPCCGM1_c1260 [Rhizobium leguminosarum bv. phaseoli CCGM1]PWI54115.1 hypothetical protein B5K03_11780 [Rhizobium phaseoli]
MTLKLLYRAVKGEFEQALREKYQPLAEAGQETIQEIADQIKTAARQDIASAGFSKRWQNALRADVYPKGKVSLNAAALIYHKIPYADVFESGATISGKPLLWLPLKSTPKKVGRNRMTPDRFMQAIGPLQLVRRAGGKPLLFGKMSVSKNQAASGDHGNVTLAKLRKGAAKTGIIRAVPLFVGVDSVRLRDRFSINEIVDRAVDRIGEVFVQKLGNKDID